VGYQIRIATEVINWLERLRETEPATVDRVDEALARLRDQGAGLGPPLVVPLDVEVPVRNTYLGFDEAYQRQLQMLTKVRRGAADLATTGRRLDLRVDELEQEFTSLEGQRRKAREMGRDDLAAAVAARLSDAATRLAALRDQRASTRAEEDRLTVASRRLQDKIDSFRSRKEALKADASAGLPVEPVAPRPLLLSELRPGAPGPIHARILFTVEPPAAGAPSSGTAILLAAGTPRDQLDAWYAVAIRRCRDRYERGQGDTY
jgi:hypothetical protein